MEDEDEDEDKDDEGDGDGDGDGVTFRVRDTWKGPTTGELLVGERVSSCNGAGNGVVQVTIVLESHYHHFDIRLDPL